MLERIRNVFPISKLIEPGSDEDLQYWIGLAIVPENRQHIAELRSGKVPKVVDKWLDRLDAQVNAGKISVDLARRKVDALSALLEMKREKAREL